MTTKLEQSMFLYISVATMKYLWLLETIRYSLVTLKQKWKKYTQKNVQVIDGIDIGRHPVYDLREFFYTILSYKLNRGRTIHWFLTFHP